MASTASPQPRDPAADANATEWRYRMEVAHELPLIDLDHTPVAALLSKENHEKFLGWMRRKYARFGLLYRISGAFMIATLVVPRSVGYWLAAPTMLMAIPSLSCGVLMNSSNVLRILPRQYEFWFFTILNAINWSCLASFYSDFRIVSLFGGVIGTQWLILIDANFRTVTSSIRNASVAAPVLLVLGIATFFRIIDTDDRNYRVIPVAKVKVTLLDIFVNTAMTLALFIARKAYAKRKVLITHSAELQTIRCVVFRSKLQLKKSAVKGTDSTATTNGPDGATTAASFNPAQGSNEAKGNLQQVRLASLQLPSFDVRHVVAPQLSPIHAPLTPVRAFLFHANAVVGFTTTVFTLTRRPAGSEFPPTTTEYALAITALVTTLVFFLTCVASFHRALARSLLRNFDFLFSSVQFTLAILLICDMVQWDFRTLGALAWLLGFHSVLFLDALTPPIKRHLQFRKIFLLPVIVASLVAIVFIIYGFFFSHVAEYFIERTLWETRFHGKTISLRTKSLLMNRLFTVLLWSFRLIWEVAVCPDDELIFIRGSLDYLTPMEMFPPLKNTPAVAPKKADPSNEAKTTGSKRRWCSRPRAVYVTHSTD